MEEGEPGCALLGLSRCPPGPPPPGRGGKWSSPAPPPQKKVRQGMPMWAWDHLAPLKKQKLKHPPG